MAPGRTGPRRIWTRRPGRRPVIDDGWTGRWVHSRSEPDAAGGDDDDDHGYMYGGGGGGSQPGAAGSD